MRFKMKKCGYVALLGCGIAALALLQSYVNRNIPQMRNNTVERINTIRYVGAEPNLHVNRMPQHVGDNLSGGNKSVHSRMTPVSSIPEVKSHRIQDSNTHYLGGSKSIPNLLSNRSYSMTFNVSDYHTTNANNPSNSGTDNGLSQNSSKSIKVPRMYSKFQNTTSIIARPTELIKDAKSNRHGNSYHNNVYNGKTNFTAEARQRLSLSQVPNARVTSVSCAKLFGGDATEMHRADAVHRNYTSPKSSLAQMTSDCPTFRRTRGYITMTPSVEEESMPLAFIIAMYMDPEQTERLLRAIYRPHNFYCIHVDQKAESRVYKDMAAVASCFPNVKMASTRIDVTWGTFSVLLAELTCMKELWQFTSWRYLINLTGQEFPLKTNLELVRILKTYNGANDIAGSFKRFNPQRTDFVYRNSRRTEERKSPPPHGIRLTKGSMKIVASRGFIGYLLHQKVALDFLTWVKDTWVPDETFFTSLNHNPLLGAPGAFTGDPDSKPYRARFILWQDNNKNLTCAGKWVRGTCVFGVGDLPLLNTGWAMFVNKFHYDFQPLAYACMEEWHYNKTRNDILGLTRVDLTGYKDAPFISHHV